jgi:hypothetical protein
VSRHARIVLGLLKLNAPLATQQEPISLRTILVLKFAQMDSTNIYPSIFVIHVTLLAGNALVIPLKIVLNVQHQNSYIWENA